MGDKLNRFYKFIIRNIVKTVDYDSSKDEFKINRVTISDEILQVISEEGTRYGLSHDETINLISHVSSHIDTAPSLEIHKGRLALESIKYGQHFEIHFNHPEKGANFIELVCANPNQYIVLNSSISGLRLNDVLQPTTLLWNPDFYIDFFVFRKGTRYPNENIKLHIGKYDNTVFYKPSIVYEILDSNDTFSLKKKKPLDTPVVFNAKEKCVSVWTPNLVNPISFTFDENTPNDSTATFLITYSDNSTHATLSINKNFVFPADSTQSQYLLQVITECCKCRNSLTSTRDLKYIKTLRSGVLQKDIKEKGIQRWILVTKPQIKFILE